MLATAGDDGYILFWNTKSGELLKKFPGSDVPVGCMSISPDGTQIAISPASFPDKSVSTPYVRRQWQNDGTRYIVIIEISTGKVVSKIAAHNHDITALEFNPKKNWILASAGVDGEIKYWDPVSGKQSGGFETGFGLITYGSNFAPPLGTTTLAFSPDGNWIAVGGIDQRVVLRSIDNLREYNIPTTCRWIDLLSFSPNSDALLIGSDDYGMRLWDVWDYCKGPILPGFNVDAARQALTDAITTTNGTQSNQFGVSSSMFLTRSSGMMNRGTSNFRFSQRGQIPIDVGYGNGVIVVWDSESTLPIHLLKGFGSSSRYALSPDGRYLANSTHTNNYAKDHNQLGGNVAIWDLRTGEQLAIFGSKGDRRGPALEFTPDSKSLVCSHGNTLRIWATDTRTLSEEFDMSALEASETEERFKHATDFDADGRPIGFLLKVRAIDEMAIGPNGNHLVTRTTLGELDLWNMRNRKLESRLRRASDVGEESPGMRESSKMAFSANGETLVCFDSKEEVTVWNVAERKLITTIANETRRDYKAVEFSALGGFFTVVDEDKIFSVFDFQSGSLLESFSFSESVSSFMRGLPFSVDQSGRVGAVMLNSGIGLYEPRSGTLTGRIDFQPRVGGLKSFSSIVFDPTGRTLIAVDGDDLYRLRYLGTEQGFLPRMSDYLDLKFCRLSGRKVTWNLPTTNLFQARKLPFVNLRPYSMLGIIRSDDTRERIHQRLFWEFFDSQNFDSARYILSLMNRSPAFDEARRSLVGVLSHQISSSEDPKARLTMSQLKPLLGTEETDPFIRDLSARALKRMESIPNSSSKSE